MGAARGSPIMNRRTAGLLLLPFTFLLFMTPKARSRSRAASASKSAAQKTPDGASTAAASLTTEQQKWVETTLRRMTLEEKVGQLLFTTYHGSFTSSDSVAYARMMHDIDDLHVGGFITITHGSPLGIVKSQAYPTAVLANQLQSRSKLPLLTGADFERGTAMRLDEGTSFPTAMALAAAGNPQDAFTMGKITALEARAVGV